MAIAEMHLVLDQIIKTLFAADDRRLTTWVDKLCKMHQEASRETVYGFLYAGVYYRPSNVTGPVPHKRALHPSLYSDMETFLKGKRAVDDDKAFIRQTLFSLLDPCNTRQEIRDALPECLVDCLPNLKELNRQAEAAWSIQGNARALRQYEKILPKMEIYSAARLIF